MQMNHILLTISLILSATAASADTRIACQCSSALVFHDNRYQTADCSHQANSFTLTFNETSVLKTSSNHPCDEVIANNVTQEQIYFACNVDMIDTNGEQVWYSLKIDRISGTYEFWQNAMKMTRYGNCKKASNAF